LEDIKEPLDIDWLLDTLLLDFSCFLDRCFKHPSVCPILIGINDLHPIKITELQTKKMGAICSH
jgi:hypothetical protein